MLTLAIENEVHSLIKILNAEVGAELNVLLADFSLFEDWLTRNSEVIMGFVIGKYSTTTFDFLEHVSNEELFERLKALRNKGE